MRRLLFCVPLLVSGCGLSDQYSFMPAALRQETYVNTANEEPDVIALAKSHGRTLFIHGPDTIQISPATYDWRKTAHAVCVKVPDNSHPAMVATIGRGTFVSRWRAQPDDGCDRVTYETVKTD